METATTGFDAQSLGVVAASLDKFVDSAMLARALVEA